MMRFWLCICHQDNDRQSILLIDVYLRFYQSSLLIEAYQKQLQFFCFNQFLILFGESSTFILFKILYIYRTFKKNSKIQKTIVGVARFELAPAFQHAPHPKCGEVDLAPPHPVCVLAIIIISMFSFVTFAKLQHFY